MFKLYFPITGSQSSKIKTLKIFLWIRNLIITKNKKDKYKQSKRKEGMKLDKMTTVQAWVTALKIFSIIMEY
jgi:hypothetical protein